MEWVLAIIAALIALIIYTRVSKKNLLKKMELEGYDTANRIEYISFVSGHPDIDRDILFTGLFRRGDYIYIMKATYMAKWRYDFVGSIPLNDIMEIRVLDASYTTTSYVTRPDYFFKNQTRT